jgi:hypothetical protein
MTRERNIMNTSTTTDPWRGEERTVAIPPRGAYGPPPGAQAWAAPRFDGPTPPGWPPGQLPAPWPAVPAAKQGRRTVWFLVAAAVALVAVVAAAVVVTVRRVDPAPAGHASSPPTESTSAAAQSPAVPPVPVSALPGLLLTLPELATVSGSATVTGGKGDGETIYEALSTDVIVDQDCVSLMPAEQSAYQGSGYISARQQFLAGTSPERKIAQTLVSFPDADTAARYVSSARTTWKKCANRNINLRSADADTARNSFWAVGPVTDADGILRTSRVQEGGAGWACQVALAARNNVVVDFYICGTDVPDSVVPAFVNQVNSKIEAVK